MYVFKVWQSDWFCITDAIKCWDKTATETAINAVVADYLKHAPGRSGGGGYKKLNPALHAGSTTLITNTGKLIWQTTARWQQTGDRMTEKSVYHIVYGPVGRLSLTESAVGEVSGSQWDVLAGAGKQQLGAVDDDHVPVPVETTSPATALHLQVDKQPAVKSTNRQQARMETQRPTERISKQIFRQEWTHLIRYYWSVRLLFLCLCAGDSQTGGIMSPGCPSVCTYVCTYVPTYVHT